VSADFEVGLFDFFHNVLRDFLLVEHLIVLVLEDVIRVSHALDGAHARGDGSLGSGAPHVALVCLTVVVEPSEIVGHFGVLNQTGVLVLEAQNVIN